MANLEQFPSAALNGAYYDTPVAFEPQLPMGRPAGTNPFADSDTVVPPGAVLLEGGKLRLNFLAPTAAKVDAVLRYREHHDLEKGENGLWTAEIDAGDGGFIPILFHVDGVEVLNPLAPVGYGSSRPINYVDVPQPGVDFYLCKDVPHGTVTQDYYFAPSVGLLKSCLVYTPAGYMKDDTQTYPVLYLQHGHGENEKCWVHQGRANFILDNLIAEGKMPPCVVVMNNGMVQREQEGLRVLETNAITRLLLEDCIPYIQSHYRVRTDKWSRAMAGLSMGSMQTSMVTLGHPDLFGYAGVFSGFVGYIALDRFEKDRELFREKGLAPEDCPAHVEKIYHGEHEWNVWRMCLRDFCQLLFR